MCMSAIAGSTKISIFSLPAKNCLSTLSAMPASAQAAMALKSGSINRRGESNLNTSWKKVVQFLKEKPYLCLRRSNLPCQ